MLGRHYSPVLQCWFMEGGGRNNEPSGTGVVLSSTGSSTSLVKRIPASIQ